MSMGQARSRVRVGVVGVRRGRVFISTMAQHPDAELVAVCDQSEEALQPIKAEYGDRITYYQEFGQMLEHDLDAVILANAAHEHSLLAVRALDSGRHVLSEVPACQTLGEAVDLVEAVERSGRVYMMAENLCFFPHAAEMRRRFRAGDLGEFQHGEGEYVHDTEKVWARLTRGSRDHWRNWRGSTFYCTHPLGPMIDITDTRVVRVVGMETPNRMGYRYGRLHGDSGMLMCQMSNGATVKILISHGGLKREPSSHWLALYGTKGCIESHRWDRTRVSLFLDGAEEGKLEYAPDLSDVHGEWVDDSYRDVAKRITGHGGADFYVSHAFLQSVLGRLENRIDVYRGLDMSLPGLLGFRSIMNQNVPYDVPDFRDKAAREAWRGDHWSLDPKYAAPGHPTHPSSFPVPDVPDEVYERHRLNS